MLEIDKSLIEDYRLALHYAAHVGLISHGALSDKLKAAEAAIANQQHTDHLPIIEATNELAVVISPITIADLRIGRDPTTEGNQRNARSWQLGLTAFCLITLLLVGYSMNALRVEQDALAAIVSVEPLHPDFLMSSLRVLVQNELQKENSIGKSAVLAEDYHRKVDALKDASDKIGAAYIRAVQANEYALIPFAGFLRDIREPGGGSRPLPDLPTGGSAPLGPSTGHVVPFGGFVQAARAGDIDGVAAYGKGRDNHKHSADKPIVSAHSPPAGTMKSPEYADNHAGPDLSAGAHPFVSPGLPCKEDDSGEIGVAPEESQYPKWMRWLVIEQKLDLCFLTNVLNKQGSSEIVVGPPVGNGFGLAPLIADKVAVRVSWLLPFLYGLLGSALFLMRNISSLRTPAMGSLAIVMRLSLGGVAGIVVGWFSSGSQASLQSVSSLSIPFALAFLTGYGIDSMFGMFDRLNRAISDIPKGRA